MKKNYRIVSLLLACIFFVSVLASCSGGETPEDTTSADTTAVSVPDNWPEVEGTVIYVDVSAEDGGDGSKTTPYKSIPEAQAKIREIKSGEGLPDGGITVLVASGEYSIKDGIKFTEEDSGTETAPIKYVSAEKGGAILNGGISLKASDFEPLSDEEKAILNDDTAREKVVKADLTKFGLTSADLGELHNFGYSVHLDVYGFSISNPDEAHGQAELFINDERMTLSRYPNINAEDPNLRTGSGDNATVFQVFSIFEFEAPAIAIKERGVNWDLDDLWVYGNFYWPYFDAAVKVASFDLETLTVTLSRTIDNGVGLVKPFYFYNIFAETDVPGEYYIDRENAILYVYPTENFDSSQINLSVAGDSIVSADAASYITVDGFKITGSRTSGIVFSGDHLTIDNCEITDVRYNAVEINGNDITLQNSEIAHIGDAGIIATGGDVETLTPSNIHIHNNYIHNWGQIGKRYECAAEIYGCGVTLSHNEMHDSPHLAVAWAGPNHLIEYNEAYNVCLEADDCGAFYSGRHYDWYGGMIRYNYIHDVGYDGATAQGIYIDDALSGQTVYGNVIVNVSGYGIQVGGGRDNVIENNLIIDSANETIYFDSRAYDAAMGGSSHWFNYAIAYMNKSLIPAQGRQAWLDAFPGYGDIIPFTPELAEDIDNPMMSVNPANNIVRMNMYYTLSEGSEGGDAISDRVASMGTVENNYTIVDLECTDIPGYAEGDCTLADDAEAYQYGFEKLPFDEMGRIKK